MAQRNKPNVANVLDELFPAQAGPQADQDAAWIERDLIEPNPHQPRHRFDADGLRELGNSLKTHGQLQACVVRPHPTEAGRFQLISGERRWRAAAPEYGAVSRLRCTIRQATDAEMLQLALAENVHREDLSLIERARALRAFKESEPGLTWDDVAAKANVSKRRILHLVELLELPTKVQKRIDDGTLNEKHGRALLTLQNNPAAQARLLEEIEAKDLSGNQALARIESGQSVKVKSGSLLGKATATGKEAPESESPGNAHNSEHGPPTGKSEPGFTFGQTVEKPAQSDPLQQALRPAGAYLAEAARQMKSLSLSADYRHELKTELRRLRQQIDRIERDIA